MDPFTLTIGVQIASAVFNAFRGNKQNKEFQKRQQEYESKVLRDGIENSRQEFAALCQLQRELEQSMNEDRLNTIRLNSRTTMELTAYAHSLRSWPLLVPPFVIKSSTLPLLDNVVSQEQTIIPLNCILTTSMNPKFNMKVFPQLEEALAKFCLSYWNLNTGRGIRFYQQAWKNNITDIGAKIYDIKAHLEDVPTLVLSPYIESGKLIFSYSWWGMNTYSSDEHINDIYDPVLPAIFTTDFKYGDDDVSELLGSLVYKLEAFISYFADMYYWHFYKEVPKLPVLLQIGIIKKLTKQEVSDYNKTYQDQLIRYLKVDYSSGDLYEMWASFMPALQDKNLVASELISRIERLPEALLLEQRTCLASIKNESCLTLALVDKIDALCDRIEYISNDIESMNISWTIQDVNQLGIDYVLKSCLNILPELPTSDTLTIAIYPNKFFVAAFFSYKGKIVAWKDRGIMIFRSKMFRCVDNLFKGDRMSIPTQSLEKTTNLFDIIMTTEDVFAILDSNLDRLRKDLMPTAQRVQNLFEDFTERIKKEIAEEGRTKEIDSINRKELRYEDLISWIRKAKNEMGTMLFDGAFLSKGGGGLFDKYPNKMYVCLTLDKKPLIGDNHPKCVFCYGLTDDSIDDMFGKNQSVIVNFK